MGSRKLNLFYEYQKVADKEERCNNRGRWKRYICSMCKSELPSRVLLV